MRLREIIVKKIVSGRFVLTVLSGIVFAYATYAKLLEAQAVSAILTAVFMSYFSRSDRKEGDV